MMKKDGRADRAPVDDLLDLLLDLMSHAEKLPPDLYLKLRRHLERQVLQQRWTQERKDLLRWSFVCEGLNLGKGWDGGAYEYASEALHGHPAGAGPDMMGKSYKRVQKKLTSERRRPRTYKKVQKILPPKRRRPLTGRRSVG
jgi:hypothetical protein